jgi:hypothetical protein
MDEEVDIGCSARWSLRGDRRAVNLKRHAESLQKQQLKSAGAGLGQNPLQVQELLAIPFEKGPPSLGPRRGELFVPFPADFHQAQQEDAHHPMGFR